MGEKRIDLVTIGETVIDMISDEIVTTLRNASEFKRFFGGSPANIAINVANLGFRSALITRLGNDDFGRYIYEIIEQVGVITEGVQWDECHKTSVIFVGRSTETPSVMHYRDADKFISLTTDAKTLIERASIVHFSGFALSQSPARDALFEMKKLALRQNKIITFDPCFHDVLWDDVNTGKTIFREFINGFDIVKPSMDDMTRLWGEVELKEGIKRYHHLGAKNVLLTMGKNGVLISDGHKITHLKPETVEVKDATGAGDSFWSGVISGILSGKSLIESAKLGIKTSAITLQYMGAIAPLSNYRRNISG